MAEWRFHGRQAELDRLESVIDAPDFRSSLIWGGRFIGKTELMQELRRRRGAQAQILIFKLRDPGIESQAAANERLIDEARRALGETVLLPPACEYEAGYPRARFIGIIRHLLAQGAVVCLGEFQMVKPMRLEGALKKLIDDSGSISGPPRPPGKLILIASHRQRVLDMFRYTEPLYGRVGHRVRLQQWRLPTLFGMAREQGLLQYPRRMLTLWTAFGGLPGRWRNFTAAPAAAGWPGRLAVMDAWESDDAWRQAFLRWQRHRLLVDPDERFDCKAYVRLGKRARKALLQLAQTPRGLTWSALRERLRKAPSGKLDRSIRMLRDDLRLVEGYGQFCATGEARWRIADNSALFQLNVYREMFGRTGRQTTGAQALERLAVVEGHALARMAAGWLEGQPGVTWSMQGAWRQGLADIDVIGFRGELPDPDAVLVMAGCKRHGGRHEPGEALAHLESFLGQIDGKDGERLRGLERQKLLFSPAFTTAERERYRDAGFRAVGIHDMARETGTDSPSM